MSFKVQVVCGSAGRELTYDNPVTVKDAIADAGLTGEIPGKEIELTTAGFDGFVTRDLTKLISADALVYMHKNNGGAV